MTEVQQKLDLQHLLYPKCPYNDSVLILVFRIGLVVLGTLGLSFFNIWIAVIYLSYSVLYNVLVWPIKHCQHCYYKIRETTTQNGKTSQTLLPIDVWKESYLDKHVACGKRWGSPNLMILWLSPIFLLGISLFINFTLNALLVLIGFLCVVAGTGLYMRRTICPTCAFMEECHASF